MTTIVSYFETDCTVSHEGKTFEAGGALVTHDYVIGYVKETPTRAQGPFILTNWHGDEVLSDGVNFVSEHARQSRFYSDRMLYVRFRVNGVWYTGQTGGAGCVWKGRRMKRQPLDPRAIRATLA